MTTRLNNSCSCTAQPEVSRMKKEQTVRQQIYNKIKRSGPLLEIILIWGKLTNTNHTQRCGSELQSNNLKTTPQTAVYRPTLTTSSIKTSVYKTSVYPSIHKDALKLSRRHTGTTFSVGDNHNRSSKLCKVFKPLQRKCQAAKNVSTWTFKSIIRTCSENS